MWAVHRRCQYGRKRKHECKSAMGPFSTTQLVVADRIGIPFGPPHPLRTAPDPPLRQARADRPREDVQRDLAPPAALLEPDAPAAHQAPGERTPEGAIPHVMRNRGEEAREEVRACEANGCPYGGHECAEEGRAPQDSEECVEELGGVEEVARAREQDGEEVDLGRTRGGLLARIYGRRCGMGGALGGISPGQRQTPASL